MSLHLPASLAETDDVAVDHVIDGLTVHRPGPVATPCGVPMWSVVHPMPAAGHVLHLHPTFCSACFPQDSAWSRMLSAAYDTGRWAERLLASPDTFPSLNPSARLRASIFAERNRR